MLGTFLTDSDPAGVPEAVIRYVAGQLGMECGKDCFGLDQCQARLCTAILRHAVLVMAALAICAVTAALLKDRTDTQAPPPVTLSRWYHQRAQLARDGGITLVS